jgi:dTDP-4-amino-4,6-dideoxygalactose transaminase
MIPLFKVNMSKHASERVSNVLHSGYIGEGESVRAFQHECGERLKNKYVLPLNSGTSSLQLALTLADVKPGDFVISTPMTCLATNMAILNVGAHILWADVDEHTGNIRVDDVRRILQDFDWRGPDQIKAVMCVHWGGYPCDLQELWDLNECYAVAIIEDAAHAWLADYKQNKVGSESDFACFSFQAIKHLTTGDGGLLSVNSKEVYERARLLKWFCLDRGINTELRCQQDPCESGFKYHMNDIAAAIGLSNVERSIRSVYLARQHATIFDAAFRQLKRLMLPGYKRDRLSSYWLYPLLVDDKKAFIKHACEHGVNVSPVHARNDTKTVFSDYKAVLPGVDFFDKHQVNIPVGWWLSEKDLSTIIDMVRSFDNGNCCSKESGSNVQASDGRFAENCRT